MRGTTRRQFKTVPIVSKVVFFDLEAQRIEFLCCGSIHQVSLEFADPRFSYTRAFELSALELLKHMSIQDVVRHLSVSWDVIKKMQKRDLMKRFSKPCLKDLQRIAGVQIPFPQPYKYKGLQALFICSPFVFVK